MYKTSNVRNEHDELKYIELSMNTASDENVELFFFLTGYLVVTMPKLNKTKHNRERKKKPDGDKTDPAARQPVPVPLEVAASDLDFSKICEGDRHEEEEEADDEMPPLEPF